MIQHAHGQHTNGQVVNAPQSQTSSQPSQPQSANGGYDYQYKQQPMLPQIAVPMNQYYNQPYAQSQNPSASGAVSGTGPGSRFTPKEIHTLKQLLVTGEKYKWKQITKDINFVAARKNHETGGNIKNVSPTFVVRQYQSLLGLPNNQLYFGLLGSSLPYVVHGWDSLEEVD
ncbi:hypothetical protein PSN45_004074 [Yamadazyma tenuis]|nr:hypothetical protein PSN45_004074 [Yamadazyma tenuis]